MGNSQDTSGNAKGKRVKKIIQWIFICLGGLGSLGGCGWLIDFIRSEFSKLNESFLYFVVTLIFILFVMIICAILIAYVMHNKTKRDEIKEKRKESKDRVQIYTILAENLSPDTKEELIRAEMCGLENGKKPKEQSVYDGQEEERMKEVLVALNELLNLVFQKSD